MAETPTKKGKDASISNLISHMKETHTVDEREGKKENKEQLAALKSLETSFPDEFSKVIKDKGLIGEKFRGQHTEMLDSIRRGVAGVSLTYTQRFQDFFKNFCSINRKISLQIIR